MLGCMPGCVLLLLLLGPLPILGPSRSPPPWLPDCIVEITELAGATGAEDGKPEGGEGTAGRST